jgi:leader peptidase (prepilin peptidase) / N-methyltransferase
VDFDPIIAVIFALFGAVFGSFLNVCIHRLPRRILLLDQLDGVAAEIEKSPSPQLLMHRDALRSEVRRMSIVAPASACPSCKTPIRPWDNIPILSWLILRGRCPRCKASISPRYLVVELATAALFLACYAQFGLALSALKFCIFGFLLIGLISTDAAWKLLPDALTLTGLLCGLALSLFVPVNDLAAQALPWLGLQLTHDGPWRLLSLAQSALGAAIGAAFMYGAAVLYMRARGYEGMGLGDVKLLAMIGAFLGATLTIFTIFAASIAGSLFGLATIVAVWLKRLHRYAQRHRSGAPRRAWRSAVAVYRYYQLPFGVFLGGVAVLAAFYGRTILEWYWRTFVGI